MSTNEIEKIKHQVFQDLGNSYYKMSLKTIGWIIASTVTICGTIFTASVKIVTEMNTDRIHIEGNISDINNLKSDHKALWSQYNDLHTQINNHISQTNNIRR